MKKILLLSLVIPFLVVSFVTSISAFSPIAEVEPLQENPMLLDSPLFTHVADKTTYTQPSVDMSDYRKILENEQFTLYLNTEGYALRLVNLTTGFVWMSDLTSFTNTGLNVSWKNKVQSSLLISYRDGNNLVKSTMTMADNVKKKYEIESEDTVRFDVNFVDSGIALSYRVRLSLTGIQLSVDDDSIVESLQPQATEDMHVSRLIDLTFFPFLGSVYQNAIPGYAFIPSGNGALVSYENTSPITEVYTERFYGNDFANVVRGTEMFGLSAPVYGVVHGVNQNGLMTYIEDGSEYAYLRYYPTGVQTQFHLLQSTFIYREPYVQYIQGSESILVIPEERYHYDIEVRHEPLSNEDANYVGMAHRYQSILEDRGWLTPASEETSVPMQLSVLGGEMESGLFWDSLQVMTTTKDIVSINEQMMDEGINNIFYTLRGFSRDGKSASYYDQYAFSSQFGNLNDLEDLNYALFYDPSTIYTRTWSSPSTTLQTISKYFVSIEIEFDAMYRHYQNLLAINESASKAITELQNEGGVVFDGLSSQLYSDPMNGYSRHDAIETIQSWMSNPVAMYRPNEYLWSQTSTYLNLDFYHSRQKFLTDSVPFLQIALRGYLPYYSPYLNFSSNHNFDRLKAIEYGSYPSYLITAQPSYLLADTMSKNMYATYYGNLQDIIIEDYHDIASALSPVLNEIIVDRDILQEGISVVTYSNGVQIYVNYTSNDYDLGEEEIPAYGYYVKEVS